MKCQDVVIICIVLSCHGGKFLFFASVTNYCETFSSNNHAIRARLLQHMESHCQNKLLMSKYVSLIRWLHVFLFKQTRYFYLEYGLHNVLILIGDNAAMFTLMLLLGSLIHLLLAPNVLVLLLQWPCVILVIVVVFCFRFTGSFRVMFLWVINCGFQVLPECCFCFTWNFSFLNVLFQAPCWNIFQSYRSACWSNWSQFRLLCYYFNCLGYISFGFSLKFFPFNWWSFFLVLSWRKRYSYITLCV